MMSDHIFSSTILSRLAQQGAADRGVTLAVDYRCNDPLIDPDDATWVKLDERRFIRTIGKTIAEYDAVDCGAFLATLELAQAIRAAIAEGKAGSLSEGMQKLADAGRAATMDIGCAWWLDVDDPRAYALAEQQAPQHLPEIFG
jgi:choline kinase